MRARHGKHHKAKGGAVGYAARSEPEHHRHGGHVKARIMAKVHGGKSHRRLDKKARGGEVGDIAQDKAMIKSAVHKHEAHMHKGEPETKLARGGHIKFHHFMKREKQTAKDRMDESSPFRMAAR